MMGTHEAAKSLSKRTKGAIVGVDCDAVGTGRDAVGTGFDCGGAEGVKILCYTISHKLSDDISIPCHSRQVKA
jgi:hypothetical protein